MRARLLIHVLTLCAVASLVAGCRRGPQGAPGVGAGTASDSRSSVDDDNSILAHEERVYLWECEHSGNLLSQQGFSPLSQAILAGEPGRVAHFLADDFQATVPDAEPEVRWDADAVSVSRVAAVGSPDRRLLRDEIARWLIAARERLSGADRTAGFELLSFSPAERSRTAGDWNGRCRLRMRGVSAAGQPAEIVVHFHFRTRGPLPETLPRGGWLIDCAVHRVDRLEARQLLMREVSAERGLNRGDLFDNWKAPAEQRLVTVGGVYLCDFDRDGFTDVLITSERVEHNPRFYRGLPGGRFEDVTYAVGIRDIPGATQVTFLDIDNDGWEDLYFLGMGVFRNRQGKVFQNVTPASNLPQLVLSKGLGGVSGACIADFDRDGLIDIYVTRADTLEHKDGSWVDGKSGQVRGNQLLRNVGEGQFEDVTEVSGTSGNRSSTFAASWLDANDDGWPDLYVIHEFGCGTLLLNQQNGTFAERQLGDTADDFGSMGLATGDVDNDGRIDIYVSNMYSKAGNRVMDNLSPQSIDDETRKKLRRMVAGSSLHMNEGELTFQSVGTQCEVDEVGWSWGAALVDLNNDGLLDIHSTCGFMSHDRSKPDG